MDKWKVIAFQIIIDIDLPVRLNVIRSAAMECQSFKAAVDNVVNSLNARLKWLLRIQTHPDEPLPFPDVDL